MLKLYLYIYRKFIYCSMTSKEFIRRLDLFHSLDLAAHLFNDRNYEFIFKIDISCHNSHSTVFSDSLSLLNTLSLSATDYVLLDCFDRSAFEIQLKYFKSFLSRLSSHQRAVLESSHKVDNLLKFCNED